MSSRTRRPDSSPSQNFSVEHQRNGQSNIKEMNGHQSGGGVSDENWPVQDNVEIAFHHLHQSYKDIPKGKCPSDALPPSTTGKAIFMLRDWLDELEKLEPDAGAGNGRFWPHSTRSKRHADEDDNDDSSLDRQKGLSNIQHEDKANKRLRSGSSSTMKDQNPSFGYSSGLRFKQLGMHSV